MSDTSHPRAKRPFAESQGQAQIIGGVIFASFFPCCACFIAVGLLGEALWAGMDLVALAFSAALIGSMALGVFVPLWLLTLVIGIWMISEGRKTTQYGRQLTAEGMSPWGIVTDRWTRRVRRRHYYIAYRFEIPVADSPHAVIHAEDNPQAYHRYRVGTRVLVRYLPDAPEICRLENDRESDSGEQE